MSIKDRKKSKPKPSLENLFDIGKDKIEVQISDKLKIEEGDIFLIDIRRNITPQVFQQIVEYVNKAIKFANPNIKNYSILVTDQSYGLYKIANNDFNKFKKLLLIKEKMYVDKDK